MGEPPGHATITAKYLWFRGVSGFVYGSGSHWTLWVPMTLALAVNGAYDDRHLETWDAQTEQELKQLLFSRELAQLSDLQRRADQIDARVGDGPALTESVETVLVEVLRTAQARDHERVASALAPLIVSSMRAEIRNSRDMMVEALYPITGRLVCRCR